MIAWTKLAHLTKFGEGNDNNLLIKCNILSDLQPWDCILYMHEQSLNHWCIMHKTIKNAFSTDRV